MKSLVLKSHSSKFVMTETTVRAPKAGEVVIKIKSSGINPLDLKIFSGEADHARVNLPATLGMDLAGEVVEVGQGVEAFKKGDEVFAMAGGIGNLQGTLAECLTVDADFLALKPKTSSMKQAAALPLIFITAWEGMVDRAKVQAGQSVLVHGGAGGVGHMAVQIAVSFGAKVFATGSEPQRTTIEAFGATFIDYKTMNVQDYIEKYTAGEGFDIVFDTVGGPTLDASFVAAKNYVGHVVSVLGWGTHKLAPLSFKAATYSGIFTLLPMLTGKCRKHHGDILRKAAALWEAGQLTVRLDPTAFTLETVDSAYALLQSGKADGKVVVSVQ